MKYLAFLISITLLCSCFTTTQVVQLNSPSIYQNSDRFIYKTDTLEVIYSFWAEEGKIDFTVFNKSNKPLYLDWSRSMLIAGNTSFPYYEGKEYITTKGSQKGVNVPLFSTDISLEKIKTNSVITKEEKVTFLPPSTNVQFSIDDIYSDSQLKLSNIEWTENKVAKTSYNENNSPIQFRNYLSFSFENNLENAFFVDHKFYAAQILEMKYKQFSAYDSKSGKSSFPYKNPKAFYLNVKKANSAF